MRGLPSLARCAGQAEGIQNGKGEKAMPYKEDDILTLSEVASALRLNVNTVKRRAAELGGLRFGNRWRFRWGEVLAAFKAEEQPQIHRKPIRLPKQPASEASPNKKAAKDERERLQGQEDPYGLRAALFGNK